jgi:hypothetical protein
LFGPNAIFLLVSLFLVLFIEIPGIQTNSLVFCHKKPDIIEKSIKTRKKEKKLNIVTILLSSVSKDHFHRMLPLTTTYLREMHKKGTKMCEILLKFY